MGYEIRGSLVLVHACLSFEDGLEDGRIRHRDQAELNAAVESAASGASAPTGRNGHGSAPGPAPISPLVAVTLAAWGLAMFGDEPEPIVPLVMWG